MSHPSTRLYVTHTPRGQRPALKAGGDLATASGSCESRLATLMGHPVCDLAAFSDESRPQGNGTKARDVHVSRITFWVLRVGLLNRQREGDSALVNYFTGLLCSRNTLLSSFKVRIKLVKCMLTPCNESGFHSTYKIDRKPITVKYCFKNTNNRKENIGRSNSYQTKASIKSAFY